MNNADRKMPDRILGDWSNFRHVVCQFRNLGYSDTYILNTVVAIADVKNGKDLFDETEKSPLSTKTERSEPKAPQANRNEVLL